MTDPKQVAKLIRAVQKLSQCLKKEQDLHIHSQINQFYLMEKCEELSILSEQLVALQQKTEVLSAHLTLEYNTVFIYWRRSSKLFNLYLRNRCDRDKSH